MRAAWVKASFLPLITHGTFWLHEQLFVLFYLLLCKQPKVFSPQSQQKSCILLSSASSWPAPLIFFSRRFTFHHMDRLLFRNPNPYKKCLTWGTFSLSPDFLHHQNSLIRTENLKNFWKTFAKKPFSMASTWGGIVFPPDVPWQPNTLQNDFWSIVQTAEIEVFFVIFDILASLTGYQLRGDTIPRYQQTMTELIVQNGETEKVSKTGYIFRFPNGSPLEGYHCRSGYCRQPEQKRQTQFCLSCRNWNWGLSFFRFRWL